jgi:hypothetical protein
LEGNRSHLDFGVTPDLDFCQFVDLTGRSLFYFDHFIQPASQSVAMLVEPHRCQRRAIFSLSSIVLYIWARTSTMYVMLAIGATLLAFIALSFLLLIGKVDVHRIDGVISKLLIQVRTPDRSEPNCRRAAQLRREFNLTRQ